MGGFLGIGGKNSKQQNQAVGNLNNLFNFGFGTGKTETGAGGANLDAASGYFSKLASGNRPAMMQAIAPETSAIRSQGDASRRQAAASGTARGGGTAGENQTQKDRQMAQIDTALFGARPAVAKEVAAIGGTQAAVGGNLLGTASSSTAYAGDIATGARTQAAKEQASAIQMAIGAIFG
jgi:hypothetical protein